MWFTLYLGLKDTGSLESELNNMIGTTSNKHANPKSYIEKQIHLFCKVKGIKIADWMRNYLTRENEKVKSKRMVE